MQSPNFFINTETFMSNPVTIAFFLLFIASGTSASNNLTYLNCADRPMVDHIVAKLKQARATRYEISILQNILRVTPDGIFGPKSSQALFSFKEICAAQDNAILKAEIELLQRIRKEQEISRLRSLERFLKPLEFEKAYVEAKSNNLTYADVTAVRTAKENGFKNARLVEFFVDRTMTDWRYDHSFSFKDNKGSIKIKVNVHWLKNKAFSSRVVSR